MYFRLLEGQRVAGSDMKNIHLASAEPPQENPNAKVQGTVMDSFGFPVSTDVLGLGTKFCHKKKFHIKLFLLALMLKHEFVVNPVACCL